MGSSPGNIQPKDIDSLLKILPHRHYISGKKGTIKTISCDPEKISPQTLFIIDKNNGGENQLIIDEVIEKGATVIICEKHPTVLISNKHYVLVEDSFFATALIANWFYDQPSAALTVVGVTGTNGKTTVATLLWQAFQFLGYKAGLISTVAYYIGNLEFASNQTTPDAIALTQLFYEMKRAHCEYVVMEVSSHGIFEKRIAGISFKAGVFTNLSSDHLDFHHSMQEYREVKKRFFSSLSAQSIAVTNLDDKNSSYMCDSTPAKTVTYGTYGTPSYKATNAVYKRKSTYCEINGQAINTKLIGKFNLSNCLAAFATLCELGVSKQLLGPLFRKLRLPRGRMDISYGPNGRVAIVDYAHNPDGLEQLLSVVSDMKNRHGSVLLVFGCGGDRDKLKRPLMGAIAALGSDFIFLTSDNPRFEDPVSICEEIARGITGTAYEIIADRKAAIKAAVKKSCAHDVIVLAGKGHEQYQIFGNVMNDFSDLDIIRYELNNIG